MGENNDRKMFLNTTFTNILPDAAVFGYLTNQEQRQVNFMVENNVPLSMIAQQFSSFNDPLNQNLVGCPGSYPVYNEPSISASNKGYLNYMNNFLKPISRPMNQNKTNDLKSLEEDIHHFQGYQMDQPKSVIPVTTPISGKIHEMNKLKYDSFNRYNKNFVKRYNKLQKMISEQNPMK